MYQETLKIATDLFHSQIVLKLENVFLSERNYLLEVVNILLVNHYTSKK